MELDNIKVPSQVTIELCEQSQYRGHPENDSLRSLLIPHLGTIHPINGSRRIGQYDSINERLPLYWNCISSVQIPLMENQDLKISLFLSLYFTVWCSRCFTPLPPQNSAITKRVSGSLKMKSVQQKKWYFTALRTPECKLGLLEIK